MMNIRVIQPPYPKCVQDTPASIAFMLEQLHQCDESLDLILLPECCNAPSGCGDSSLLRRLVAENTQVLLDAAKETAMRCKATVGINLYVHGEGYETTVRNATLLFDSQGQLAAQYDKQHLPVSEYTNDFIDHSYLGGNVNPFCAEVDGVRYAFLTCYDMYYAEFIHRLSLEKPDVVLICSLQRAERPDILELQGKNTAFVCNSYVVRSSYHMGPGAQTGACSMVVAPDGKVLRNFGQELGSFDCQIPDIHWKFRRSNGYGQPEVTNDVYQTLFRAPWCYRAGGSGVKPDNAILEFPRICASRGFPAAAPENSVAGIGLAVALGAPEVQIDVRFTADGIPVLSRDADAFSLTGKAGLIRELTWEQLREYNPGKAFAPHFDGMGYDSLEAVFAAFPRRTTFQLHIPDKTNVGDVQLQTIRQLAERYDCAGHYYIASEEADILRAAAAAMPDAERCLICPEEGASVAQAKALDCRRIQLSAGKPAPERISEAKEAGLRCNLVLAEPGQARAWLETGVDCIVTGQYLAVRNCVETR